MTFTIENIAASLARYLAPEFPGVTFYEDPNQQGTEIPCMFLQQRRAEIKRRAGDRYRRRLSLDLVYLEDYNRQDLQRLYLSAAETLDRVMETFPYVEGDAIALVRTQNREWNIELDALHYKFDLEVWAVPQEPFVPMEELDLDIEAIPPRKQSGMMIT